MADAFQVRSLRDGAVTAVEPAPPAPSPATATRSSAWGSWSGRGAVEAGAGQVITVNPAEAHDGSPVGEERAWFMGVAEGLRQDDEPKLRKSRGMAVEYLAGWSN